MKSTKGMQPDAASSLTNAMHEIKKAGIPVNLNSGFRSPQEQEALYQKGLRGENPYPVAPPGQSRHQQGTAADLGIAPEHREAANAILAKHGWTWNGPSDAVHYDFTSSLQGKGDGVDYDTGGQGDPIRPNAAWVRGAAQDPVSQALAKYGGAAPAPNPDPISAALSKYSAAPARQQFDPSLIGGGTPQIDPEQQTPSANNRDSWGRRALDYGENYLYNTVGNSGNDLGQRLNYLVKPMGDLANAATFGMVGNVIQHAISPLRAGALQTMKQMGGALGIPGIAGALGYAAGGGSSVDEYMADNGFPGKPFSPQYGPAARSAIWQSMVKAWNGQQDPTLPKGLANAASNEDNPLTQVLDFAADWETGGKFAHTFFSPFIRGAGSALGTRLGSTLADAAEQPDAGLGTKAASALVNRGIGGNIRPVLDAGTQRLYSSLGNTPLGKAVIPSLQAFAKTGEDYRQGINSVIENTKPIRSLENVQDRLNNQINDYSRKLSGPMAKLTGDSTNILGNSLDGTQRMLDHPELEGRLDGNMIGALVTHYSEAGAQGAMFDSPAAVLQQATHLFPDVPDIVPMIQKFGEESKAIHLAVGQASTGAGLMTPGEFAENAGQYIQHNYKIQGMTKGDASYMAQELASQGHANTPLFAIINNISREGGASEGPRLVGGGGEQDVIKQREVLDPDERLARLPDFDYTKSSKMNLQAQLREVARANILKQVANPQLGMSLANAVASDTYLERPLLKQPALVGEAARNAKAFAGIQNQFEKKGGINDTQNELAGKLDKSIEAAKEAHQKALIHYANEPQQPPMPGLRPSVEPELRSGGVVNEGAVAKGTPFNRGNVVSVAAGARGVDAVRQALNNEDLNAYAKELTSWQRAHKTWRGEVANLQDRVTKANDLWQTNKAAHDAHLQLIDTLKQKAEMLNRRNELLSGNKAPDDDDAADALAQANKKVDPSGAFTQEMTPQVQRAWLDAWKQHFSQHNQDIFSDIGPKGLARVPAHLDPAVIQAMSQNNPLIAMALGKGLSAGEGEINPADAAARGWTQWGSANEDYGAMQGRWASAALKHFVDDAMDPHRFGGNHGEMAGITKFFGEMMRSGKLYLNPASHANVFVQSVMDNWATAADAGKVYNPSSDLAGRREWSGWLHGGEETPTVKAILDFGNEMGGGPRQSVDPMSANSRNPLEGLRNLPGKLGKAGAAIEATTDFTRSIKDAMRQRFVNEQVFPKAGLVKVLMDQGVPAQEAALWAEKAHGGAGADMGGIETPGIMKMAETLNRNGVAMFTSYPLHSITRMLQLMETNPQIVMTYPLLRNYLVQSSSPEIQQEAHDKAFGYDEIPLPLNNPLGRFFANPSGGQGVINVSNAIPYGGAFGDMNAFPNLYGYLHPGQEQIDAIDKSGLNPVDAAGQAIGARAKGVLPGSLTALQQVYNASRGMTPTEGATQTQSVQQAIMKLVGLPFHNPETGLSREFDVSKLKPIQGRMEFLQQLQSRYYDGKDSGEPDMTKRVDLQRMDYDKLSSALDSAINKSTELTTDRSLNQKQAYGMLRNQMGYIHSLMYLMKRAEPRAESFQQSQGIMTGGLQ